MNDNKSNVFFVSGHSGGHIIPCISQAKKELENNFKKIYFITTKNLLDNQILNQFDFIHQRFNLPMQNIPTKPLKFIKFILDLKISFFKSLYLLFKYKPNKVISMGGLISIPVCLAAKILSIEIEIWELNVEPGKAVKFLANFVKNINVCFEDTKKYFPKNNCIKVNYPIRFSSNCKQINKAEIISKINFDVQKKTILVVGGSQGSDYINNLFKNFILHNLELNKNLQIIHQIGNSKDNWDSFYKSQNFLATTFSFHQRMDEFYHIADLIICRSGAGTLAEIEHFEKNCITIPLETKSTNHQLLNAKSIASKFPHKIKVFRQCENSELFIDQIKQMINSNQ